MTSGERKLGANFVYLCLTDLKAGTTPSDAIMLLDALLLCNGEKCNRWRPLLLLLQGMLGKVTLHCHQIDPEGCVYLWVRVCMRVFSSKASII